MARRALGLRARGAGRLAFEINGRPKTEPGLQARSPLSRKARAFTALLGFEYRVSAFLINRTLRPSAPRIFGFHVGFAGGFRKTSLQTTP